MIMSRFNAKENPETTFTGSLFTRTDQVDVLWSDLKEKCSIAYPLESFPYGMREFAIYDNNGYLLQFGQVIDWDGAYF